MLDFIDKLFKKSQSIDNRSLNQVLTSCRQAWVTSGETKLRDGQGVSIIIPKRYLMVAFQKERFNVYVYDIKYVNIFLSFITSDIYNLQKITWLLGASRMYGHFLFAWDEKKNTHFSQCWNIPELKIIVFISFNSNKVRTCMFIYLLLYSLFFNLIRYISGTPLFRNISSKAFQLMPCFPFLAIIV